MSKAEFYVGNLPRMAIPLVPLKEQPIALNSQRLEDHIERK